MWNRLKNTFVPDIKTILHKRTFLVRIFILFIIILSLKFIFPLFSDFIYSKTGLLPNSYYSLAAIIIVSIIPILMGIGYINILKGEKDPHVIHIQEDTPEGRTKFLLLRMVIPAFFSFVLVMIVIILANPVPTEGWLRTLFVAFLFSIQSLFVFLFISVLSGNKNSGLNLSWLYVLFLIALPLGLLLHHPWNYFTFFSPLYWIACTWIVRSPFESLIYGSIALIMTSGAVIVLIRQFLRKYSG